MAKETLVALGTIGTAKGDIAPGDPIPSGFSAKDIKRLKELGLVGSPPLEPVALDGSDTSAELQSELDAEREKSAGLEKQLTDLQALYDAKADVQSELDAEKEKSADLEKQLTDLQAANAEKSDAGGT